MRNPHLTPEEQLAEETCTKTDEEIFRERSWEITSAMAALSKAYLKQVPTPVMIMIVEAKLLHKEIAAAAEKRDAQARYHSNYQRNRKARQAEERQQQRSARQVTSGTTNPT